MKQLAQELASNTDPYTATLQRVSTQRSLPSNLRTRYLGRAVAYHSRSEDHPRTMYNILLILTLLTKAVLLLARTWRLKPRLVARQIASWLQQTIGKGWNTAAEDQTTQDIQKLGVAHHRHHDYCILQTRWALGMPSLRPTSIGSPWQPHLNLKKLLNRDALTFACRRLCLAHGGLENHIWYVQSCAPAEGHVLGETSKALNSERCNSERSVFRQRTSNPCKSWSLWERL